MIRAGFPRLYWLAWLGNARGEGLGMRDFRCCDYGRPRTCAQALDMPQETEKDHAWRVPCRDQIMGERVTAQVQRADVACAVSHRVKPSHTGNTARVAAFQRRAVSRVTLSSRLVWRAA